MQAPHDPALCRCGIGGDCTCLCNRCQEARNREWQIKRLQELEDRMTRANIDMEDFAELFWRRIEPAIERRIAKIVADEVRSLLKNDIVLVSRVSKSSLENWEK